MSGEKETTAPCHYCLHVSPLRTKVSMITGTNAKRQLTWGNGNDIGRGLGDVGLHTEQLSPSRPGGQMLVVNFLSCLGYDMWFTARMTWHSSCNVARTLDVDSAE